MGMFPGTKCNSLFAIVIQEILRCMRVRDCVGACMYVGMRTLSSYGMFNNLLETIFIY